jgi:hypothetical protein
MDEAKLYQFVGQMLSDLGGATSVALVRMGDALGLYKTLHQKGPMTVPELAAAAGVNERYLRGATGAKVAADEGGVCPDEGRAMRSSPLWRQAQRFGRRHSQPPIDFPCSAPQRDGNSSKTIGNPANVGWYLGFVVRALPPKFKRPNPGVNKAQHLTNIA